MRSAVGGGDRVGKGFSVNARVTFSPGNSKIVALVPGATLAYINKDEGVRTDSSTG